MKDKKSKNKTQGNNNENNVSDSNQNINNVSNAKSDSIHSPSNSSFSINRTNLISNDSNLNQSEERKNSDEQIDKIKIESIQKHEQSKDKLKADEKNNDNENNNNLIFIRKNFKFDEYEKNKFEDKIKTINYIEDASEIIGNSFEYDTINYIFEQIYSISSIKDFSIIYNFKPNIATINKIFDKHKLYQLEKIQFDFIIIDLKISDLLKFLKVISPGIHPNSKMSFSFDNKIFNLDELENLSFTNENKNTNERIDILGEIGVNIFNEDAFTILINIRL